MMVGRCSIPVTLLLEVTAQNPIMSFWKVTFSTKGSICLEYFRTVTSETMKERSNLSVFVNMNLVFSFAACANSLMG